MFKVIAFLAAMGATDAPREQINCIATAVYHESRGEDISGKMAVAHVIMNRVAAPEYPDTACEVVYQPNQFSYIGRAKPNRDSAAWLEAIEQAAFAYAGYTDDNTGGALHYYAHDIVYPYWASKMQVSAVIGGHTFKISSR